MPFGMLLAAQGYKKVVFFWILDLRSFLPNSGPFLAQKMKNTFLGQKGPGNWQNWPKIKHTKYTIFFVSLSPSNMPKGIRIGQTGDKFFHFVEAKKCPFLAVFGCFWSFSGHFLRVGANFECS